MHKVHVSNRKYTFQVRGSIVGIERHGEAWHEQEVAFNALHSIMCELDAARVVLEAARALGDAAPQEIREALARHAALVSDTEKPSEWAAT